MRYLLAAIICYQAAVLGDTCQEWFRKSGVVPGKDCRTKCSVLATGMDTASCTTQCDKLCDTRDNFERILGSLAYYPGLTQKERELIERYPKEALKVFMLAQKAEAAANEKFGRNSQEDESDAFRHYVWACLLSKELGSDFAKEFLDAHESGNTSDPASAMDLANNRAGLIMANKLRGEGKLTQGNIEREAMNAMNNGSLIILKPLGRKNE